MRVLSVTINHLTPTRKIMNGTMFFVIVIIAIIVAIIIASYLHKRHKEYRMSDIEKAVRSAFPDHVVEIEKKALGNAIKRHFHCSSKEAHYIIGVARRKKLIDMEGPIIKLHA